MLAVICIKCLQPIEIDVVKCIFQTGFRQVGGVNYHLAVCENCPIDCYKYPPEKLAIESDT